MNCLYRFANRIFYLATKIAGKNSGPNKRAYKINKISERYFEPCHYILEDEQAHRKRFIAFIGSWE